MSEVCRLVDRAVVADFSHASIIQEFVIGTHAGKAGESSSEQEWVRVYMVEGLGWRVYEEKH